MAALIDVQRCTGIDVHERTLHLIDIENLACDPAAPEAVALDVLDEYLRCARWQPGDHAHIAANPALLFRIGPSIRIACKKSTAAGRDGADRALMRCVTPQFISLRFGRVVIGSGDGDFIAFALEVRALGVGVLQVSPRETRNLGWRAHHFPTIDLDQRPPSASHAA